MFHFLLLVNSKILRAYKERGTGPGHGGECSQVGCFSEDDKLLLPNRQDLFFEGVLPGVQLEDFDAVKDLIHQLDTSVLVLHLFHLRKTLFLLWMYRPRNSHYT